MGKGNKSAFGITANQLLDHKTQGWAASVKAGLGFASSSEAGGALRNLW